MKIDKIVAAKVVNEPKGIIRALDKLNRICLPIEYVRTLQELLNGERELEMLMFDESTIILRPFKK